MGDIRRADLTHLVYSRLRDPVFRRLLKAVGPGGERPVVVALRDDLVSELLRQVHAVGGSASVVLSGLVDVVEDPDELFVLSLEFKLEGACTSVNGPVIPPETLRGDCTVGVLLERVQSDAPSGQAANYNVAVKSFGTGQCDRAKLISIATG